jgi:hypothetical protein
MPTLTSRSQEAQTESSGLSMSSATTAPVADLVEAEDRQRHSRSRCQVESMRVMAREKGAARMAKRIE